MAGSQELQWLPLVSGALAIIKNAEEEAFQRKLTEPEVYAQLVRRTLPLKQSKALVGNGFFIFNCT
ncbi:hypothetical protein BsIDN1_23650 [Bacillus safensis]|uniref:Uncharacterized protein n=1 Tax=Bacillus safensis TaxID=561879 RepID=A0A5S9M5G5_BACIA|nr:hypothetical protein BsIDN1_23650 [Bacillus safensis]